MYRLSLFLLIIVLLSISNVVCAVVYKLESTSTLFIKQINLSDFGIKSNESVNISASFGGEKLKAQFVPSAEIASQGKLVLLLPRAGAFDVDIQILNKSTPMDLSQVNIITDNYNLLLDKEINSGFPGNISIQKSGRKLDGMFFIDRLFNASEGVTKLKTFSYNVLSDGELCTVVRQRGEYKEGITGIYDWYFFKNMPVVYVDYIFNQDIIKDFAELHFCQIQFNENNMSAAYISGHKIDISGAKLFHKGNKYGLICFGDDYIAQISPHISIYDGDVNFGTYLHNDFDSVKNVKTKKRSSWIAMGSSETPVLEIEKYLNIIEATRRAVKMNAFEIDSNLSRERIILANALIACMNDELARKVASSENTPNIHEIKSDNMVMFFEKRASGIAIPAIADLRTNRNIWSDSDYPFFEIQLRNGNQSFYLNSLDGWKKVDIVKKNNVMILKWSGNEKISGISVTIHVKSINNGILWNIDVSNKDNAIVWDVDFPRLSLSNPGEANTLFIPWRSGQIHLDPFKNPTNNPYPYAGDYSMQFFSLYDINENGIYISLNDSLAATKSMNAKTITETESLAVNYLVNIADRNPGNTYRSADAQLSLYNGNWYEASQIYRAFVEKTADWMNISMKQKSPMDNLDCWMVMQGVSKETTDEYIKIREYIGQPIGIHMYNWHVIPFDNDYPHYLPAKDGFKETVLRLKENGMYPMPYINARLWDTRDNGTADYQYSSVAKPAVVSDERLEPVIESYGSKEADGSDVKLAVMCPYTKIWQNKVKEIVCALLNDYGVSSVYMDQVAAAQSFPCHNPEHGHLVGGGSWWNDGYYTMLKQIRTDIPENTFLTTECNHEPFVGVFEGYLTWYWQNQGLVPAFSAVYSDKVYMFGRNFTSVDMQKAAVMKLGQQLVFGEQLGWMDIPVLRDQINLDFFKATVNTRSAIRDYLQKGHMLRPPTVLGDVNKITADWNFGGKTDVTLDGIQTGAWEYKHKKILIFVNINVDKPAVFTCDISKYSQTIDYKILKNDKNNQVSVNKSVLDINMAPLGILVLEIK